MSDIKKNVQDMNEKFVNLMQNDFIGGMRYSNGTLAENKDSLKYDINIVRFEINASSAVSG